MSLTLGSRGPDTLLTPYQGWLAGWLVRGHVQFGSRTRCPRNGFVLTGGGRTGPPTTRTPPSVYPDTVYARNEKPSTPAGVRLAPSTTHVTFDGVHVEGSTVHPRSSVWDSEH